MRLWHHINGKNSRAVEPSKFHFTVTYRSGQRRLAFPYALNDNNSAARSYLFSAAAF